MVDRRKKLRTVLVKAVIAFVVVAGGVTAGLFLAVKIGLTSHISSSHFQEIPPPEIRNQTVLTLGVPFPDISVVDDEEKSRNLAPLLADQPSIVAIVKDGCEPCHYLIDYLTQSPKMAEAGFRVILLSVHPEPFRAIYAFPTFGIDQGVIEKFKLSASPTIIGVNKSGIIAFITCGFGQSINVEYFHEYLDGP